MSLFKSRTIFAVILFQNTVVILKMTRLSSQIIKVLFVIFYLLEEEELALNEKVEAPIPESTLQSSQKRDKPDSQLDAKQKKKEKFAELKVSFACCFSLETTKGTECKKQNNI